MPICKTKGMRRHWPVRVVTQEMASIGLPVPPGFTLTTEVCTHFYQNECNYPKELTQQAVL